jgi:predicted DsbA family dithiol-disulfide isomerase
MTHLHVTHFTDPGCPYAFCAEPQRLKLLWHYGDHIDIKTCLIELSDDPSVYEKRGFTPAKMAKGFASLQKQHGMPIALDERPRLGITKPACMAIMAARVHGEPGDDEKLLRAFRVRIMAGDLPDEDSTRTQAATDAGIDPEAIARWMTHDDVAQALAADKAHARDPLPAALALGHKLSPAESASGKRYSAPSYEFGDRPDAYVAPGYQPFETYDAAIANILQDAAMRKPAAESVSEVLAWADYPLATAEVAALREIPIESARDELAGVADFDGVGEDGYWTLHE